MPEDDDIGQMLDDVESRSHKLNEWENGFIDSISKYYAEHSRLTPPQKTKLDEIWERVT